MGKRNTGRDAPAKVHFRGSRLSPTPLFRDDPDVNDVLKFLREQEIVHFQRFSEALERLREHLDEKNVYYMSPALQLNS